MKLIRDQLKPALDRLNRVVPSRTTLPILSFIRMCIPEKGKGRSVFALQASSGHEHLEIAIPLDEPAPPMDICVNARQFTTVIEANDEVEMDVEDKAVVFTGNGVTQLPTMEGAAFPPMPADKLKPVALSVEDLLACVRGVVWVAKFFKASETIAYRMSLHLAAQDDRIQADCTCGNLLASDFRNSMAGKLDVMVMSQYIESLLLALSGPVDKVAFNERWFCVSSPDSRWMCGLPEGTFPAKMVGELIDNGWVYSGLVMGGELIEHLEYCRTLSGPGGFVDLDLEAKGMSLGFDSGYDPKLAPASYKAEVVGKFTPARLRYNLDYIVESIKQLNRDLPIKLSTHDGHLKLHGEGLPRVVIGGMVRPGQEAKG